MYYLLPNRTEVQFCSSDGAQAMFIIDLDPMLQSGKNGERSQQQQLQNNKGKSV